MTATSEDQSFRELLKQHGDKWRIQRHKDRVLVILGKYATIHPNSATDPQTLLAACIFPSPRYMTARLKLIHDAGVPITMRQIGDGECVFSFNATDLDKLQKPLRLRRRRKDYNTQQVGR